MRLFIFFLFVFKCPIICCNCERGIPQKQCSFSDKSSIQLRVKFNPISESWQRTRAWVLLNWPRTCRFNKNFFVWFCFFYQIRNFIRIMLSVWIRDIRRYRRWAFIFSSGCFLVFNYEEKVFDIWHSLSIFFLMNWNIFWYYRYSSMTYVLKYS